MQNAFGAFKHLIDTAGQKRSSRVAIVVLACLGLAALCLLIGLAWGAWDAVRAVSGQEWLLPIFLTVFFVVMAVFAPFIPVWMVNVPDNEVWMILDSTDHLEKFVGSGVYPIKPIQSFKPYPEKGMFITTVALDQVVTSDHFPYRVTVSVSATLNPLAAHKDTVKVLRSITKEGLAKGIQGDITDIVKRQMYQVGRQEIDPPTLMAAISEAIREAIAARANLGVSLAATNPIKVNLEPPREVLDARNQLWAEEFKAEGRVKHLAEMLKLAGATNMSVGDLGRLHFVLNPQPGMRLNIQGNHDLFAPSAPSQAALPPPARPPIQMPRIEAPTSPAPRFELPLEPQPPSTPPTPAPRRTAPLIPSVPSIPTFSAPPEPQSMPPMHLPEDIPSPPEPRRSDPPARKSDPDVIETVQDENGTYVPTNPILRRKKSRTSFPPQNSDDSGSKTSR